MKRHTYLLGSFPRSKLTALGLSQEDKKKSLTIPWRYSIIRLGRTCVNMTPARSAGSSFYTGILIPQFCSVDGQVNRKGEDNKSEQKSCSNSLKTNRKGWRVVVG